MPNAQSRNATLRILRPGLRTLVVDFGRPRSRSRGVPVSGAADRTALTLGNGLVGNPGGAAALEITLAGPTLIADAPLACVVTGAEFAIATDRRTIHSGKTFTLQADEELRIGGCEQGVHGYFCVRGGLLVPEILGSRSGLAPLQADDRLACHSGTTGVRWIADAVARGADPNGIRVLPGRQAEWFARDALHARVFAVTAESDRMGLRLRSEPLEVPGRELVSEPVCPGSVQVTHDGQCIVLGVDGQTIGGYPKIAQVITADLDKLARLRPGDKLHFQEVTLDIAESALRQRRDELNEWLIRLRVAAESFP